MVAQILDNLLDTRIASFVALNAVAFLLFVALIISVFSQDRSAYALRIVAIAVGLAIAQWANNTWVYLVTLLTAVVLAIVPELIPGVRLRFGRDGRLWTVRRASPQEMEAKRQEEATMDAVLGRALVPALAAAVGAKGAQQQGAVPAGPVDAEPYRLFDEAALRALGASGLFSVGLDQEVHLGRRDGTEAYLIDAIGETSAADFVIETRYTPWVSRATALAIGDRLAGSRNAYVAYQGSRGERKPVRAVLVLPAEASVDERVTWESALLVARYDQAQGRLLDVDDLAIWTTRRG
jgi:hypothetical protein